MTLRSPAPLILATVLAGLGCAVSQPIDSPSSAAGETGAAGLPGAAGAGGSAAALGAAGSSGVAGAGVSGIAGRGGGTVGSGGSTVGSSGGAPGAAGRGGTPGTAGRGGTAGATGTSGTAGSGGVTNPDAGTATFTEVYTQVISNNCFGSACHNPAGADRPSFATQAACYTFFKNQGQLYPGQDPSRSYIYFVMSGDPTASPPSPPYMPPAPNPNVSADDLAIVAAWIAGGALDN
jgi:hypothetical protein